MVALKPMTHTNCPACGGSGKVLRHVDGETVILQTCGVCGGAGELPLELANSIADSLAKSMSNVRQQLGRYIGRERNTMSNDEKDFEELKEVLIQSVDPKELRAMAELAERRAHGTGIGAAIKQIGGTIGKVAVGTAARRTAAHYNKELVKIAQSHFKFLPQGDPVADAAMSFALPMALLLGVSLAQGVAEEGSVTLPKMLEAGIPTIEKVATTALEGVTEEKVSQVAPAALNFMTDILALGAGLATGQLTAGSSGQLPSETGPVKASVESSEEG